MFDKSYYFKMIRSVVLILLSLRFSFVQTDQFQTEERILCYYSRYANYYIMLTNLVFNSTIGKLQVGTIPLEPSVEAIDVYEKLHQSQGYVFMAMLEDLRLTRLDYKIPNDLIKMNLYLNHVVGYTRVLAKTLYPKTPMSRIAYEKAHKLAQNQAWFVIEESLKNCEQFRFDNKLNWYTQDPPQLNPKLEKLNQLLLPRSKVITAVDPLEQLNENKKNWDDHFKGIITREAYLKFHPRNMLFNVLMSSKNTYTPVGKSYLIQNVVTYSKVEGGKDTHKTINNLFIEGLTNFSKDFVLSFQHRVLAATTHPIFMCVSTYLKVIEKLFYPGEGKFGDVASRVTAHENTLKTLGNTLLGYLKAFVDFTLFPGLTQEYLVYFHRLVSDFVNSLGNNLHLDSDMDIPTLLKMCYRPMEMNKFVFQINVERFSMVTEDQVLQHVKTAQKDIAEIGEYVSFLEKHVSLYHMVTETFYHDEMFLRDPSVLRPPANKEWLRQS